MSCSLSSVAVAPEALNLKKTKDTAVHPNEGANAIRWTHPTSDDSCRRTGRTMEIDLGESGAVRQNVRCSAQHEAERKQVKCSFASHVSLHNLVYRFIKQYPVRPKYSCGMTVVFQ